MPLDPSQESVPQDPNEAETPILLSEEDAAGVLASGVMREQGLLPYSSNHSFLVTIAAAPSAGDSSLEAASNAANSLPDSLVLPAVYKPQRGESPLWDFEWGSLCQRETAAYEISRLLGWRLVPPTVLRNGTRGLGSVQLYIHHDEEDHYFTVQADARYAPAFRRMALFDYVINNADRKSGHCLVGSDGQVWAIDHGVCLHTEFKLRTVIWEFGDSAIDPELMDDLAQFRAQLADDSSDATQTLCHLLSPDERRALQRRVTDLIRTREVPGARSLPPQLPVAAHLSREQSRASRRSDGAVANWTTNPSRTARRAQRTKH